jgi:hypothetical protein
MITLFDQLRTDSLSSKQVVIYYSGHAFQKDSTNYLAPVDIHVNRLEDLDHEAISVDYVINAVATVRGPKIILLDACRSQFKDLRPGLARVEASLPDLLIGFSTSPDHTADDGTEGNSPFTKALLKMMMQPGLTVEESLREVRLIVESSKDGQIPWDQSSLTSQTYFRLPLFITAQIQFADDDAMIIVNGSDVTSWGNDGSSVKKIPVHAGFNPFLVRVFNQRSYTGGIQGLGGHLPEGWKFSVVFGTDGGPPLATFGGNEDRPEDNGPRHGKWFTVVRGTIYVDEDTSEVRLTNVDAHAWLH